MTHKGGLGLPCCADGLGLEGRVNGTERRIVQAGQGFLAAVIVNRSSKGETVKHEVYRDIDISGGHR